MNGLGTHVPPAVSSIQNLEESPYLLTLSISNSIRISGSNSQFRMPRINQACSLGQQCFYGSGASRASASSPSDLRAKPALRRHTRDSQRLHDKTLSRNETA